MVQPPGRNCASGERGSDVTNEHKLCVALATKWQHYAEDLESGKLGNLERRSRRRRWNLCKDETDFAIANGSKFFFTEAGDGEPSSRAAVAFNDGAAKVSGCD